MVAAFEPGCGSDAVEEARRDRAVPPTTPGRPTARPQRVSAAQTAAIRAELSRGRWLERAVLQRVYGGTDGAWRLTTGRGPSEAGRAAARALGELPAAHGLDPRGYHAPQLARLIAALATARPRSVTTSPVARLLARARLELTLADGLAHLVRDLGLDNAWPAALERLWQEEERQRRWSSADTRRRAPDADGRLWGWRYAAHACRWLLAPATLARVARTDGAPDPRVFSRAHVRRLLAWGLRGLDDRRDVEALLAGATPAVRQYDRLVAALARYRAVVAAGGWGLVRPTRARGPGRRHAAVTQLRRRLAREGYLDDAGSPTSRPAADDTDDGTLRRAVRAFQRNHLLEPTGIADRAFFGRLNINARQRMTAIERGLRRWRESGAGSAGLELRVNIPGFSLEVWRGPRRLLRQRVVVGKRHGTRCDEDLERRVLAYATPEQSARVERLVFFPYWNVTRTIKETELDPERGKDPLFYQKHGYELLREGSPFEWVRQLPGPENALGLVKLIFANPHETYLHDTPDKHLFGRPRRSFSHGCIRVADALGLARLLLQADGQWDESLFGKLHRTWRSMRFASLRQEWDAERYEELVRRAANLTRRINLRRPIPIHVEYHTVRVDDRGRVAFFDDLYRLELRRRDPARRRGCVPESVRARRGFAEMLMRLALLEQQLGPLAQRVAGAVAAGRSLLPPAAKLPGRQRRLRRRLAALERFEQDHGNLSARIRAEHAAVEGPIRRRRPRLVARAVRVQRLMDALEALHRRTRETCDRIERLRDAGQSAPPASRGGSADGG